MFLLKCLFLASSNHDHHVREESPRLFLKVSDCPKLKNICFFTVKTMEIIVLLK